MKYFYKIRNKKNGLFSQGGDKIYKNIFPKLSDWSKGGKVWKRRSDLQTHFYYYISNYNKEDLEVVAIPYVETIIPIEKFLAGGDREVTPLRPLRGKKRK